MALIDDVKAVLRVTSTAFNTEINDLIDAAKENLELTGIINNKVVITDPLIKQYILTYVKAYFGWDNPDAEKLKKSLHMMEIKLTLARTYTYYILKFEVTDIATNGIRATVNVDGTEAYTDENGEVEFYLPNKNNVEYTVMADGYISETEIIDVNDSKTINVVLVEV